jgi:alpha-galactosidase
MEYYGAPLPEGEDLSKYVRKNNMVGTATIYDEKKDKEFSLDTASLEFSTPHKGDYGDPSIILASSKGFVYDFVYEKYEIRKPKEMKDYPNPREAEEELVITFVDEKMGARIHLHYITYKNSAIFGRYLEIENFGEEEIRIQKAASLQLILDYKGYEMVTYYGGWADEFHENVSPITHVRTVIDSLTGSSSARHNPFFYVRQKGASVDSGETYAFNLIYSGNHFEEAELTTYGKIRIQTGISSICFE